LVREYNIAGFGGQGILFLGQVLANAGIAAGKNATWLPSYGPEMRGGTANCNVVVSDDRVLSPLVYHPDIALIFNKPSLEKYLPDVKKAGIVILDSDFIDSSVDRSDLKVFKVPAKTLAENINAPMSFNMVILGVLLMVDPILNFEHVKTAIEVVVPGHRRHLADANLKAVQCGIKYYRDIIKNC